MATLNTPYRFKPETKYPLKISIWLLFIIYIVQYPLARLLAQYPAQNYSWDVWVEGFLFVIFSSIILLLFLRFGMAGSAITIRPVQRNFIIRRKPISLLLVVFVVGLFFLWSYLMKELKIGMTIYIEFNPLPYRVVGLLFYGRLFIQPLVLLYFANGFAHAAGVKKNLVIGLIIILGAWVALTSGSRFAAFMFAIPLLLIAKGNKKVLLFLVVVMAFIIVASLSRNFYLPFVIGGRYIEIYANASYQMAVTKNIFFFPLKYLIMRLMGMKQVLLTLNYGAITDGFVDAFLMLINYYLPINLNIESVSIKNIYGLSDDHFGGFGLDLFSNYWVFFGGKLITFSVGLALSAWLMGRAYIYFSVAMVRFGLKKANYLIFIFLFILLFEGRAFLFPYMLVFAWYISRPGFLKLLYALTHITHK